MFSMVHSHCVLVLLLRRGPMLKSAETFHGIQLQAEVFDYAHRAKDYIPPGNKTTQFNW